MWDKIKQFVYGALSILIPASLYIFIDSRRDRRHIERLRSEYDNVRADLEQFRRTNGALEQQLDAVSGEHRELTHQCRKLKEQYDKELEQYTRLLEQTRGKLSDSQATVGELQRNISKLKEVARNYKAGIEQLRTALNRPRTDD